MNEDEVNEHAIDPREEDTLQHYHISDDTEEEQELISQMRCITCKEPLTEVKDSMTGTYTGHQFKCETCHPHLIFSIG